MYNPTAYWGQYNDLTASAIVNYSNVYTSLTTRFNLSWVTNGSGSGTVNSGTGGKYTYYSTTGTTVDSNTPLYTDNTAVGIGNPSLHVIVNPTLGTIDYAAGVINIKNLNITSLADSIFEIIIKPQSYDIVSAYTQIAQIDSSMITVTAVADPTLNGDLRAGKNYTFASSRS